jgi:hypothetical protein
MRLHHLVRYLCVLTIFFFINTTLAAQQRYHLLHLPDSINSINEEFSGMDILEGRVYLLPQYGSHMNTKLDGDFFIYSISADSISRNIEGKDEKITSYKVVKVRGLAELPDSLKMYYEGFEAVTFIGHQVFLSMETVDSSDYCYILKGEIDASTQEITIDPKRFTAIKRYPYIKNAGFEGLSYLPAQKKLIAIYEFNGSPDGGTGYLIDPDFKKAPKKIKLPFLPFRITDTDAAQDGSIYAINYYYGGDYGQYLNNQVLRNEEESLKTLVPELKDSLIKNPNYLRAKGTGYARIVKMKSTKSKYWSHITSFDAFENNWEGMVLFGKGTLIITDANRNKSQKSTLSYIEF